MVLVPGLYRWRLGDEANFSYGQVGLRAWDQAFG